MSRIFRKLAQTEPLAQGDVFAGLPLPEVRFREGIRFTDEADGSARPVATGALATGMRFLCRVEVIDAIVLDQSCDTLRSQLVMLAPLREFDLCKAKTAKDKWG